MYALGQVLLGYREVTMGRNSRCLAAKYRVAHLSLGVFSTSSDLKSRTRPASCTGWCGRFSGGEMKFRDVICLSGMIPPSHP